MIDDRLAALRDLHYKRLDYVLRQGISKRVGYQFDEHNPEHVNAISGRLLLVGNVREQAYYFDGEKIASASMFLDDECLRLVSYAPAETVDSPPLLPGSTTP
jgi:hypothetical protein